MTRVDSRTAANRRNAQKSTGPITDEGKARSRANAFKHGLAGQGVAWPGEEQAEVDAFVSAQVQLERPQDERETFLAARAAALAWQIARADRIEAASARALGARGKYTEMERRDREVEALVALIEIEPHRAVRSLLRSPEGCEWVLIALREFDRAAEIDQLLPSHNARLDALCLPPVPGLLMVSRARLLVEACCTNTDGLWPMGIPGLAVPDAHAPRSEWAAYQAQRQTIIQAHRPAWLAEIREILRERIAEIEQILADHLAEPDPGLELAELTAAFDDSPRGERLRRYQRSNIRERRLTLQELEAWRDGKDERESRPAVEFAAEPEPEPEAQPETPPAAGPEPASDPDESAQPNVQGQAIDMKGDATNWVRSAGSPSPAPGLPTPPLPST